jgi:di/tricarboxylate transporter
VAIVANIVTVAVAALLLRAAPDAATGATTGTHTAPVQSASRHAVVVRTSLAQTTDVAPFGLHQWATVACLVVLAVTVAGGAAAGVDLDIGMLLLGLGAVLALLDPATGARAFARIDWSTAFIVGGIVTYVGVLQKLDAVTQLGRAAMAVGSPIVAALLVCTIAALVSAVASTTAVLAALVPMAVPLATSGAVPGWALITALGVSATIVDGSPFSNTGATLIAAAAESDRPRLRTMLLRWSMAMVVAGPLVVLPVLLALARWGG